ncbi:hypothetical protein D2T33_14675 [Sinirhodobacter populi]|uniref:Uncharacterized protein n=1 Tax=Paenirhodobacter populi TaxID=2306993 RepID=A0A443IRV8_9RHOB|nr:hypothetical protein D2T33_14675 [Sinirhodobacter populi]
MRAFYKIMARIELEPAERNLAFDRFGLGRYDGIDPARLQPAEDLGIGIARICCRYPDRLSQCRGSRIDPARNMIALVRLPGRDLHLGDDPQKSSATAWAEAATMP